MNDQELANKIGAHGVGKFYGPTETQSGGFSVPRDGTEKLYIYSAHRFVRDWRVAGACLQRWPTTINVEHLELTLDEMLRDPRAINEAYVKAHRS